MNLLDMIIIALMIFLIVRGIFRGFFREIGSLAGVILGIGMGCLYQQQMSEYLKAYVQTGKFLQLISFAVIFFVVLALCNLSGWGVKMILKKAFLGWTDRALGVGLAVLKGIIITYLLIILLTFFVPSNKPLIAGSTLAPLIIASYQTMVDLIEPGFYQNLKKKFLGKAKGMDEIVTKKFESITN
jgi:membrane protein required for colicin V production